MFDQLRAQIIGELQERRIGVLSAGGELGPHALPVQYRLDGIEVRCLLPRWSEIAYALEENARVLLVVLSAPESEKRWVRYQGTAELIPSLDSADDRFYLVRIRPARIDLIDEGRGWGARETLDLE
jgi:nitroimidazol reductase NimA-like FMN-containing flavoprotein (pyridoxamine 5'-phosphate oxidase superfamily)